MLAPIIINHTAEPKPVSEGDTGTSGEAVSQMRKSTGTQAHTRTRRHHSSRHGQSVPSQHTHTNQSSNHNQDEADIQRGVGVLEGGEHAHQRTAENEEGRHQAQLPAALVLHACTQTHTYTHAQTWIRSGLVRMFVSPPFRHHTPHSHTWRLDQICGKRDTSEIGSTSEYSALITPYGT